MIETERLVSSPANIRMDEHSDRDRMTDVESEDDEFSLIQIANAVLRQWRLVLVIPALFALAVGLITYSRPRLYEASASFFPQEAEGGRVSSAFALAQQFGVDLGGSKGPTQSPQFYADLVQSRALLRQVVESKYKVNVDGATRDVTLMEFYRRKDGTPRPWLQ